MFRTAYSTVSVADIWMTTWDPSIGDWQTPLPLPEPINSSAWEGDVAISPDGATLYFTSDRNVGGAGVFGIYQAAIVPEPFGVALVVVGLVGLVTFGSRERNLKLRR